MSRTQGADRAQGMPVSGWQRVAFHLLWVMIPGLPILVLTVRFITDSGGWLTLAYLLYGSVLCGIVQIVLLITAIGRRSVWRRAAIGPRAAVASLVYYVSWVLLALAMPDVGDGVDPVIPSLLMRLVGEPVADGVAGLATITGVVALLACFLLILTESGRVPGGKPVA